MEKEIVYYRVGASLTPKDLWYNIEEIWVQKVTDKTIFHSGNKKLKVEDLNKVITRDGQLYNGYMSLHVFVANKEEIEQAKRDIVVNIERKLDKFQQRVNENRVALTITQESYRKLD
jgi:tRNA U34 5-methylaminomethyl-2-thiouridine-forming methyltransferase MnmC